MLSCGHQCPSVCGEECKDDYCPLCTIDTRRNMRVDLLEMKTLSEVDLDDSPIVVLGCGHAFTTESLDGSIGMSTAYVVDYNGAFSRARGSTFNIDAVATTLPRCPDCQCPVRQYATRRYNRVINRAVIDETSRRFLTTGSADIAELTRRLEAIEANFSVQVLKRNGKELLSNMSVEIEPFPLSQELRERYKQRYGLTIDIDELLRRVDHSNQPYQKLLDAVIASRNKEFNLETKMDSLRISPRSLNLDSGSRILFDQQVFLRAQLLRLKAQCLWLQDKFEVIRGNAVSKMPYGLPTTLAPKFLDDCEALFSQACDSKLPKIAFQSSICYLQIARLASINDPDTRTEKMTTINTAKSLLEKVIELCSSLPETDSMLAVAEKLLQDLSNGPRYEVVTTEELAAIKAAMASGSQGLSTHSGHWYNCRNGHPVSVSTQVPSW